MRTASVATGAMLLLASACEKHPPPTPPRPERAGDPGAQASARAERAMERLRREAGLVDDEEPPIPGGDLRAEIAAFDGVDRCSARKASALDPAVADALDGLAYASLPRDACRMLDALAAKDPARCQRILASALRSRCEADVAILAGDPSLCPEANGALRGPGRDPVCLARAGRDERACAAALPSERTRCRALVRLDPDGCSGEASCVRTIARWRGAVEPAAPRPAPETAMRVEVRGEDGTPDPPGGSVDLREVAAAGAVIRRGPTGATLLLGAPRSAAWPAWDTPGATPRAHLEAPLPGDGSLRVPVGPTAARFELSLPGIGVLASTSALAGGEVELRRVGAKAGEPIELALSATVRDGGRKLAVRATVTTFVREVDLRAR